ncbi:hypothetical protein OHC33_006047 [Knufia fluminis]|uniref:DUF6594 domain-containing protein n=1 Tax=Knufia fluminis TaxID=191047 RepID=A0AAN8I794_9EURO|nr:hypothetical protein OHC33_006047 [Knufia fluminis]
MAAPASTPGGAPSLPLLTEEDIQRKPWRYIGYKGFSEWMASDDDFFVVRRLDSLTARVILLLQWGLTKLEIKLEALDFDRSRLVVKDLHNGSLELDDDDRQQLVHHIHIKLKEYHDFPNGCSELKSKPDATSEATRNVQNWLGSHAGAIDTREAAFIDHRGDLFSIHATFRTPLRRTLEKFGAFETSKWFRKPPNSRMEANSLPGYYDPRTTIYHSNKRTEGFVNVLICVAGFTLLVVPLWILFHVSSRQNQLIVITIFIAFFLAIVQSVSVARPFESLAATAAYSAVLMVFMQIGPRHAGTSS